MAASSIAKARRIRSNPTEAQRREVQELVESLQPDDLRQWLATVHELIATRKGKDEGWGHDLNLTDEENRRRRAIRGKKFPWN